MPSLSPRAAPLVSWALIGVIAAGAILFSNPPLPAAGREGEGAFALERALRHVEQIAKRPHAWGTAANREVRAYLVETLSKLGYEVAVRTRHDPRTPMPLENVVARRRGTKSTGLVAICAHYDSTAFGPGAGDDAAAVAAMLETARIVVSGPGLRNDLLLLLTDGEEAGLLGARAFCRDAPEMKEISVILNFEARGNAGRSLMFETSLGNGDLIGVYAGAVAHPAACSLMSAFYRLLPNSTDFATFQRNGLRGLNFAFIGGAVNYHAPSDTPARLSRASLWHHGTQMLALTRAFGRMDLRTLQHEQDATYFDLAGHVFVTYPAWLDWPLTALALLGLVLVLRSARHAGRLDLRSLGHGVWLAVRIVVSCAIVAGGLGYGLLQLAERHGLGAARATSEDGWFFLAFVLAFACCATGWARFGIRRRGGDALAAGLAVLLGLLLLASTIWVPGASFLWLWPLVLLLPALHGMRARPARWLAGTAWAGVTILVAPLALLLLQGMGLQLAIVPALILAPFLGLAAVLVDPDAQGDGRWLVGLPALLAVVSIGVGLLRL